MNFLVIGATGGTGRELLQQSLEQGHSVTAFVRNPEKLALTHHNLRIAEATSAITLPSSRQWWEKMQSCVR